MIEKQYKSGTRTTRHLNVFGLLITMRSSLFLLALAAVNGVAASIIPSQCPKCIYKPDNVPSYLNAIQPVAKCVLKHKLAGPAIDGDVNL